ncbi:winged helix-turn-helix domain-containing protein, partial [Bacillus velezensis]|uniref:winged helix-turn-helix domain-containing protein n=1 Tax=Bacillus velezensis TaxID=492670 RepID=UPI001643ED7B
EKRELCKKERKLLEVVVEGGEKVRGRDGVMEKRWETEIFVDDNRVNVYIRRVRKKVGEVDAGVWIEWVGGEG